MLKILVLAQVFWISACGGSTGDELVTFRAGASGPSDAVAGEALEFVNGRGFRVVLTEAKLTVGAMYLNQTLPVSGAQATSCILPGTYVAEVVQGAEVDLLSPAFQEFPVPGAGTTTPALAGEVWFSTGDVNDASRGVPVLSLTGTADGAAGTFSFTAQLTIGSNRLLASPDPAQPSLRPICKERVVSPIPVKLRPREGGALVLRVDPRLYLFGIDFATLSPTVEGAKTYAFGDDPTQPMGQNQASVTLYQSLHAAGGPYSFAWLD